MTFSLFKYFDAILDGVEKDGLAALEQPEVKKALAELDSFLPSLSNIAKLVFSYFYVYTEKGSPFSILDVETNLGTENLYLRYEKDWQRLLELGLLDKTPDGKFVMPKKVMDAVAIIDMEYYFPREKPPLISAEHKKEVFWRLVHDKDLDFRWREMYERGEVCK